MKKNEQGSISLYVLIACTFFVTILMTSYISLSGKAQTIEEGLRKIKENYADVTVIDNPDDTIEVKDSDFGTEYGVIDIIWMKGETDEVSQTINKPILVSTSEESMVAVKFDKTSKTWVEAINPAEDTSWYDYSSQVNHWANARTQNGSYFVWIPRYAYRITYYKSEESYKNGDDPTGYYDGQGQWNAKTGKVRKILEDGIKTIEYNDESYIIHPAFCSNTNVGGYDRELTGIWVAKYEMSGNSAQTLQSVEGTTSISGKTIGTCYEYSRNANYGYKTTGYMESHLIKNSEWGAVAYLTQSKFGRNGSEVAVNESKITGGNRDITTTISQSTTQNVYGIYDMSGGSWEYVAATDEKSNSNAINNGWTKFENNATSTKFETKYKNDLNNSMTNYVIYTYGITGDATKEVNMGGYVSKESDDYSDNWNNDNAGFLNTSKPYFKRGGMSDNGDKAGIFSSMDDDGSGNGAIGFRTVLCPENNNAPISENVENVQFSTNYGVIDIIWMKGNSLVDMAQVPNKPVMISNNESMEAVEFNESSKTWTKVADSNSTSWYSYDGTTNKWANARTQNGSYFVWIPRYAYRITYYESEESYKNGGSPTGYYDGYGQWSATTRKLKSQIEDEIQTKEYKGKKYIIHPAFCTDTSLGGFERELEGIWVAKYEASGDSSNNLSFVPGVSSFANRKVGDQYNVARNANYGYKMNGYMDSHMMKNSEWGAVTYLSYSKFGNNRKQIVVNMTGYTGGNTGNGYINNTNQSTTGNVYGIYDMAGGLDERMSAFHFNRWSSGAGNWTVEIDGEYVEIINMSSESNKYITKYKNKTNNAEAASAGITGDATIEITNSDGKSWFGEGISYTTQFAISLRRGGSYAKNNRGIMAMDSDNGSRDHNTTFRAVLCP